MDEPMRITRSGDTDAAGAQASPSETEWRAGLAELVASIQRDLTEALEAARGQALEAVRAIEERGAQLFSALDEERDALDRERDAEQSAREERVAALQSDIEGVEAEIRDARTEAERDAESIRAAARRRADVIVAEAEARAEAIIAEAHERAASGSAAPASAPAAGQHDVQGRLRGLSDRVGRLLSQPGAGVAAVGLGAAGIAAAAAASAPQAPVAAPPPPPPPAPVAPPPVPAAPAPEPEPSVPQIATRPVIEERRPIEVAPDTEIEEDDEPPAQIMASPFTAAPAPPPVAPVQSVPAASSSSWFKDDLADDDEEEGEDADDNLPSISAVPSAGLSDDDLSNAPTGVHAAVPRDEPAAPPAESAPTGPVTQTLIFQAVPNFQAALALERSLKAMSEVREVRVADFDERQLTFQVTHELGNQLSRVLLTQRGSELELVDSRPERVEFMFRS